MKNLSGWVQKISTTWLMIASLLLMMGMMFFVLPTQSAAADQVNAGTGSPDLSFYYPPDRLWQMAEAYGPQGREAYIRARWTFDLVFPAVYVTFLAVGLSWFNNRLTNWPDIWKHSNLLPILGGVFDLLENTAASLTMAVYPARQPFWPLLASLTTPIKWILVSVSFALYFILAGAVLLKGIRNRPKNRPSTH